MIISSCTIKWKEGEFDSVCSLVKDNVHDFCVSNNDCSVIIEANKEANEVIIKYVLLGEMVN
jgi:hypothetical protein